MSKKKSFSSALTAAHTSEKALTENGAVVYKRSKSPLVDFYFTGTSFRNQTEDEVRNAFAKVHAENPLLAVKLLFMMGDIRQGMGERRTFRTCMQWLADNFSDEARKVLHLIPEYSRWDILVDMLGTSVDDEAFALLQNQFKTDQENCANGKPVSLLAKWLPSVNTSSDKSRMKARSLCSRLKMKESVYRKSLSKLRSYLNVVETKMSAKDWSGIEYSAVPSKANLLYKDAFLRHDETRRNAYLQSVERGEEKINAGAVFPCDICFKYNNANRKDTAIEEMWKALPDFTNGRGENVLCIVDGSGSMTNPVDRSKGWSTMSSSNVAQSLAVYFSEKMPGQFNNQYITFSEHPEYVDLSGCKSLFEKLKKMRAYDEVANTNIKAVFKLILQTAVDNDIPQEEMPQSLLILSDMQFDSCVDFDEEHPYWSGRPSKAELDEECATLFDVIGKEYKDAGYELPRLVFWNINSDNGIVPMQENKNGVALLSGFSASNADMIFSNKTNPYDILVDKLNSKRYEPVEKALA